MLQEATDGVAFSAEKGKTNAMTPVLTEPEFWLVEVAEGGCRKVKKSFEDKVLLTAEGTPWKHEAGDFVVDGRFWSEVEHPNGLMNCYVLGADIVSVPTHLLACQLAHLSILSTKRVAENALRRSSITIDALVHSQPLVY